MPHNQNTHRYVQQLSVLGFTLIEMMIVLIVIAILVAIGIPTYKRYVIHNAESQAMSRMMQLSVELEKWRASALTYRGFYPSECSTASASQASGTTRHINCYDTATNNTQIYLPTGTSEGSYRYKITLTDYASSNLSLIPTDTSASNVAIGRDWKMVATPNPTNTMLQLASNIYLDSHEIKCKALPSAVSSATMQTTHACGEGTQSQPW